MKRAGDIASKFKKKSRVKFLQTVLSGPTEAFKYVIASTCSRQCSPRYLRREKSKSVAAVIRPRVWGLNGDAWSATLW